MLSGSISLFLSGLNLILLQAKWHLKKFGPYSFHCKKNWVIVNSGIMSSQVIKWLLGGVDNLLWIEVSAPYEGIMFVYTVLLVSEHVTI